MSSLLQEILNAGGINVFYQPIFEVVEGKPSLFAIEALSRGPAGTNAARADVLFEYVRRKGKEVEVDRACVQAILSSTYIVARQASLTINVHASTVERDDLFTQYLVEVCHYFRVPLSNLILEIVEQQKYSDERRFFRNLDLIRSAGVRIALDDVGLGYSNHRMLIEIRPEFYKIDRYFITHCKERDNARAAIQSILLLADRLRGRVIAEGIESADDLDTVTALGIQLVQGFHLAEPRPVTSLIEFNHCRAEGSRV